MKQTTGQALQGFRPSSPVRLGKPSFHSAEPLLPPRSALLLVAMFSMSSLSAGNTVAGAGKDVQSAGEKVEDKAKDCSDGKC